MSYITDYMRKALQDHVLIPVETGEKVKAFYLQKPNQGRMMSTLIVFTPEGIVLQGDLTPTDNGNISCLGYGLDWFADQLSEDYLCEKFLRKEFRPEVAEETIRRDILEQRLEGDITKDQARDLWNDVPRAQGDWDDGREFYEFWTDELQRDGCDFYSHGYNPGAAGWLCAIQQRFAALYNAAYPAQAMA